MVTRVRTWIASAARWLHDHVQPVPETSTVIDLVPQPVTATSTVPIAVPIAVTIVVAPPVYANAAEIVDPGLGYVRPYIFDMDPSTPRRDILGIDTRTADDVERETAPLWRELVARLGPPPLSALEPA